jgi:hypothetical protein
MLTAAARRRVAALRQRRPAARLALALWIVWAIAVWNVVFDHTVVVAGRHYIAAADRAAFSVPPQYENMDLWMRPAIAHGVWLASAIGGAIAAAGFLLVRAAERSSTRHDADGQVTPCA